MKKNNEFSLTAKNLDNLAKLLGQELEQPFFVSQIPDGAHIFYGEQGNLALTDANLQLVSKILLGIMLGYVEDAPLMMIYSYESGKQRVINLSDEMQKDKARVFIKAFEEESRREMGGKLGELVAV